MQLITKMLRILLGVRWQKWSKNLDYFIRKTGNGYFSINQLDRKLEPYVNYDYGFFVELGANDGISQSNSLYFELKRNWQGILIEPSPHNFLRCRENRSSRNKFFCNACVGFDYKEKYVDIRYANLMSVSESLDLDIEDKNAHVESGRKFLSDNEDVFLFGAVAETLNTILQKSKAPAEIDFLSLDVEGAELEVLKGIDFDQYSFKYMLIEVRDLNRMKVFLKKNGYALEEQFSPHDFLFKYVG